MLAPAGVRGSLHSNQLRRVKDAARSRRGACALVAGGILGVCSSPGCVPTLSLDTRAVLRLLQVAATAETPSHPEATAARVVEQMQQFVRRANEQTVLPADTHLRISFEGAVAIAARQFDAPKRSVRVRTRMHSKLIILSQRQFLSRRLPRTRLPR